jgi:hypothetical protein
MTGTGIISAMAAVFKALRASLTRKGVVVGGTADYPRVEIHSITESEWMDKGNHLKSISCIVECVSDRRMQDVMDMNEENLHRMLIGALDLGNSWKISGIVAGQLQELNETSDTNAILYRLLQNMTIYVERISE